MGFQIVPAYVQNGNSAIHKTIEPDFVKVFGWTSLYDELAGPFETNSSHVWGSRLFPFLACVKEPIQWMPKLWWWYPTSMGCNVPWEVVGWSWFFGGWGTHSLYGLSSVWCLKPFPCRDLHPIWFYLAEWGSSAHWKNSMRVSKEKPAPERPQGMCLSISVYTARKAAFRTRGIPPAIAPEPYPVRRSCIYRYRIMPTKRRWMFSWSRTWYLWCWLEGRSI